MDETGLMRLDAGKMHLGAAFYAIDIFAQTFGFALTVWHLRP